MSHKMNKNTILLYAAVLAAPLGALLTVILRTVALLRDYEGASGYYTRGAALPRAVIVLLLLYAVAAAVLAIVQRPTLAEPPRTGGLTVLFASAFLILVLALAAILSLSALNVQDDGYEIFFIWVSFLAAIPSVIYYVLMLRGQEVTGYVTGLLALAPAFLALFIAMRLYFDRTMQMNSASKTALLGAYLLVALFCLSESRHMLGRTKSALHYFLCATTVILCATVSIPDLIYCLVHESVLVLDTVFDFLIFAYFLYALARLLQYLPSEEPVLHRMIQLLRRTAPEGETGTDLSLSQIPDGTPAGEEPLLPPTPTEEETSEARA